MDAADAVGDRDDGADVAGLSDRLEVLDPLYDQVADLGRFDRHMSGFLMRFARDLLASPRREARKYSRRVTAPDEERVRRVSCRQLVRDAVQLRAARAVDH